MAVALKDTRQGHGLEQGGQKGGEKIAVAGADVGEQPRLVSGGN